MIGPRAVEQLVETLEGSDDKTRAQVIPLLALIGDPRGLAPLIAMLLDRNPQLRRLAAHQLGGLPSAEAVTALERLLKKETEPELRQAAVQALVEQYAAGQERAIRAPLELLTDVAQPRALRLAAAGLLPALHPVQRRGILERLNADPDEQLRAHTAAVEADLAQRTAAGGSIKEIKGLLEDLGSADYPRWNAAVPRLGSCGASAVGSIVAEMQSRAHDPEFCTRAGMALKALGRRHSQALADALERIEEPLPLQVLVDAIGALGDTRSVSRLKALIERVARGPKDPALRNGVDPFQRVRAKAHFELARLGSRVAIGDLREALADPEHRLELELVAAAERIGKRDEIEPLLRAHAREDAFVQERIATAVLTIMRRERIRRNNPLLQALPAAQRTVLQKILPPPPRRRRPRQPVLTP
ncbi:MAG TPA: HEAT repeat domain-containing protein [Candidatus Polarisedimenticolaceae bacterium]|nr:HEAT repeat domain-containing protein [Candidatus Polarisedimenticolaceae bacterium]